MYEVGNIVMHPSAGVCKISDICSEEFANIPAKSYYVLKPVYENGSTIYTPVDSDKVCLRRLLSCEDIYRLIHSVSVTEPLWKEDRAQRQAIFSQVLKSGDHRSLIQLIIEIHKKKEEYQGCGKRLHLPDETALKEAERLIHQEFAYALDLQPSEIAAFVMQELETSAAQGK